MAKLFLGVPVIGHMEGLWIGNDNGWRSELFQSLKLIMCGVEIRYW